LPEDTLDPSQRYYRGIIFKGFLARELRLTIRLKGDRDLVLRDKKGKEGRKRSSLALAKSSP
jgi:hypothetical protein